MEEAQFQGVIWVINALSIIMDVSWIEDKGNT